MANSSWLQTAPAKNNIAIKMDWTQTKDIINNKSIITYNIYGVETGGNKPWSNVYHIKLWNGSTLIYEMNTATRTSDGTQFVNGGTFEVLHNDGGEASIHLYLEAAIIKASLNSWADWEWTLDPIPRAAKITRADDITDETQTGYIYFDNPMGTNVQSLDVCLTSWNLEDNYILKGWQKIDLPSSSATIYFSQADRSNIQKWLNFANEGTAYYYLRTTINSKYYYNYKAVKVSIVDGALTISPTAETDWYTQQLAGEPNMVLANYSTIYYHLNKSLKYGTTLKEFKVTNGNKTNTSEEDGHFYGAQIGKVDFWAKDSRGNEVTASVNGSQINYFYPTIKIKTRMNANGEMVLSIEGSIYDGWLGNKDKAKYNELKLQYAIIEETSTIKEEDWKEVTEPIPSNNRYNIDITDKTLDYTKTYKVQARVQDTATAIVSTEPYIYSDIKVVSCRPLFDWGRNDFNFNIPIMCPNNFVTKVGQAQYNRDGFCFSRLGDYAGKTPPEDNYYIMITSEGNMWIGYQSTSSTTITWTTIK